MADRMGLGLGTVLGRWAHRARFGAVVGALAAMAMSSAAAQGARPAPQAQPRQVVLITGSTDGLGRELALRLGAMGADVIVHGRNRARGDSVVAEIKEQGKGTARFFAADLASLADVRALADSVIKNYPRLDILICNAGIWQANVSTRQLTVDGNEMSFQVNYLSHFLLTQLLEPLLIKSAPSRIVNVASVTQQVIDLNDVNQNSGFSGQRGYGTSKLAQVMSTFDLAKELEGTGVTVNAVHPASQMDTYMVRAVGAMPMSTVAQGADAVMNVVTTPNIGTGQFFAGLRPSSANPQAYSEADRARLKQISMQLTGLK